MAIPPAGSLRKCERAGAKWKSGAEHEAGDLVSDEEIMIECVGFASRKNLPGSEFVVWQIGGSRRCKMFVVQ